MQVNVNRCSFHFQHLNSVWEMWWRVWTHFKWFSIILRGKCIFWIYILRCYLGSGMWWFYCRFKGTKAFISLFEGIFQRNLMNCFKEVLFCYLLSVIIWWFLLNPLFFQKSCSKILLEVMLKWLENKIALDIPEHILSIFMALTLYFSL